MNRFTLYGLLLAAGFAIGFCAAKQNEALARGAAPTDGWSFHRDVDHHFPEHPAAFAHHWCKKIDPRLTECQLYDSDAPNARLVGVEPIVSDGVFKTFSASEQRYWHWHKTSHSLVVNPDAAAPQRHATRKRDTTHGKTVLLWDPRNSRDPIGAPRVIPH